MKRYLLYFILLLAILPMRPVRAQEVATNIKCPVLTDEAVDSTIYTDYQGKRVFFCCNKCRRQFLENPEKYLANLPQFASLESGAPITPNDSLKRSDTSNPIPAGSSESKLVRFIGKFHPVMVHFPIALVFAALFFAIFSRVTQNIFYDQISVPLSYLAALAAIITVFLGLAAGFNAHYPAELTKYFDWHRIFGISSEVMTIITAVLAQYYRHRQWSKGRSWYHLALVLTAVIIGITGHLGATLVYGPDHFSLK